MDKRILRGSLGAVVASTALLATTILPAFASSAPTDPSLASDTTISGPATIAGGGSTFDAPLMNAAQAAYEARNSNATISAYLSVGSGAGQTDIATGLVNFGASDVPMNQANLTATPGLSATQGSISSYVQIPVALGGEAMGYNLPSITKNKTYAKVGIRLTGPIIADIYTGKITMWNDPAICAVNPKIAVFRKIPGKVVNGKRRKATEKYVRCAMPNHIITVVARSDGSGTTYAFTNYLNVVAPSIWTSVPSKAEPSLPSNGVNENGNAGVAAEVANNEYTLGYIEYSYLLLNKGITAAYVKNAAGVYLQPSPAGVSAAAAQKPTISSTNFAIVNEPGKASYPISTYSWVIVRQQQDGVASSLLQAQLLMKYIDWLAHTSGKSGVLAGQDVAGEQGYVPLPANVQALAHKEVLSVTYSGTPVL
jgi:phosphate transport system substrate-binding protein